MTSYKGINYSGNQTTNRDPVAGIRYGVISQHEILQAWADSSEAYYGKPDAVTCPDCEANHDCDWGAIVECSCGCAFEAPELPDMAEPISFYVDDGEYKAECGDDGDIFIMRSPFFTYAQFCSPCAPGACYLMNALDTPDDDNRAYCFGHDWFEGGKAPYPVYSVETGELVQPEA